MNYPKRQVAITFGDVKQAYLYFDFVIPVYIEEDFPGDLQPGSIPSRLHVQSSNHLSGATYGKSDPYLYLGSEYTKKIKDGNVHPHILSRIGRKRFKILHEKLPEFFHIDYSGSAIPLFIHAISQLAADLSSGGYDPVIVMDHHHLNSKSKGGLDAISVISSNVAEIDVSSCPWDQLRQFKVDDASRKALRNYRLFWCDNYSQKTLAFIEDDLGRKFEGLERACRKHGFDLRYKTLGNLLNSRSLLSTGAISLAAALTGQPLLLSTALSVGVSVEIGRITLDIAKVRLEHQEFLQHHDLLYLFNLKKKFRQLEE